MPRDYQVITSVVADDVRQDSDGKAIIIGAYARAMSVASFPITSPTLGVYLEIMGAKHEYNAVMSIHSPDGTELARTQKVVRIKYLQYPAALVFRFGFVQLQMQGDYQVRLGMDSDPETIMSFFVGTRESVVSQPA